LCVCPSIPTYPHVGERPYRYRNGSNSEADEYADGKDSHGSSTCNRLGRGQPRARRER
jgi:hypothetical protein